MSFARKWVFPILRILIFAAIAVALVKLAFFADPVEQGGEVPTGQIVDPTIPVMIGTIQNDVVLSGTVNSNPAIPVRATFGGEVIEVYVKAGKTVKKGTTVMKVRAELVNMNGTPYTRTETVKAGANGVLSSFTVLKGQQVGIGDIIGQVAPQSFNVTATIAPEQLYRLTEKPADAQVTVQGGPAPFTCTNLSIITPLPGSGGSDGSEGEGSGTTVRCSVPSDVRVFAGLVADITIAGGIAENVLVVPMTAVLGAADSGIVYVVGADGEREERPVTLGLNDGVNVEIIDGLAEGELIYQFVPGAAAGDGGGVIIDPGMEPIPFEDGEVNVEEPLK
ncbi:MAG: efflux RND transporter periplasmic adaptor subunit [Schumannella sp.]|nr:efflux RND transporter periplasmic adaptor subunit [Microbacteriaceae bacterium]